MCLCIDMYVCIIWCMCTSLFRALYRACSLMDQSHSRAGYAGGDFVDSIYTVYGGETGVGNLYHLDAWRD